MSQHNQAERLRDALVDRLVGAGTVPPGPVEAALRAVPRHLFVPESSLRRAYADTAVVTKRGPGDELISSVSQPTMVAIMLTQLQTRPGDRVLEIGAGGGYNAALLDALVGPDGTVTTVDIEADVAARARAALALAGHDRVTVVCGDGADGYPPGAPYDRLIVTAGVTDLAPAWEAQLTASARMVVPLTLCGSTRNVALVRSGTGWRSESVGLCGFIALRGSGAESVRRVPLGREASLQLSGLRGVTRSPAWAAALRGPASTVWTGVSLGPGTSLEDLQLYLALTGPGAYGRLEGSGDGEHADLPLGDGRVIAGADGFAYLTARSSPHGGSELGVSGYGPAAERLATSTARHVARWAEHHRASMAHLGIIAAPADATDGHPTRLGYRVEAPHHRFYISWPGWDDPGDR